MSVALGWLLAVIVIAGFAGSSFLAIRRRKRASLPTPALSVWGAKVGGLAVVVLIGVYLLNQERQRPAAPIVIQGVPWVVPLVVALVDQIHSSAVYLIGGTGMDRSEALQALEEATGRASW